jgi:hypothetical protein
MDYHRRCQCRAELQVVPVAVRLRLFFRVDDFDEALLRASTLAPTLEEEPHLNPATGTREFALSDPGGYYVMVSALTAFVTSSGGF